MVHTCSVGLMIIHNSSLLIFQLAVCHFVCLDCLTVLVFLTAWLQRDQVGDQTHQQEIGMIATTNSSFLPIQTTQLTILCCSRVTLPLPTQTLPMLISTQHLCLLQSLPMYFSLFPAIGSWMASDTIAISV